MEEEFKKIFQQAGELSAVLRAVYRETAGEDFDLESAVRHYPLVALGLAAGVGVLGGWWAASRGRPALPPASESRRLEEESSGSASSIADTFDRVRRSLPNVVTEQYVESARTWIESVVEPQLKHHLDEAINSASEGKFRQYVQGQMHRWGLNGDTALDDPAEPE